MNKRLEIGDEIVSSQYGSYGEVMKVTRLTAKRAFCKINDRFERQFKIEVDSRGYCNQVGASPYSPSYWLVTDDIRKKVVEQTEINRCAMLMNGTDSSALSPEDRATIIQILRKYRKP